MSTFAQAARNLENMGKAKVSPENRPPIMPQEPRKEEGPTSNTPGNAASLEEVALLENAGTLEDLGKTLGRTGCVLTLWSEVLEDAVLVVPDHYRKADGDPVTYTAREMAALLHSEPDLLRAVHAVKRVLGGEVLWTKTKEEMAKEETP